MKLAFTFHRMLPSALCQSVGVLKLGVFRGSSAWPVVPPVNASYPALRPCPHDSEPVWLARPSPYDSFIRYILPAWCGLHRVPRSRLPLHFKEHGAYAPGWRYDTSSPMGNCRATGSLRRSTCVLSIVCEFLFPGVNMAVANATDEVIGCELDDAKALTKTMLHNLASN